MPPHSLLSLFPFSLHLLLLLLPTTNAYIDIFLLPSYNTADRCIKDCISWHISHNLDYFTCRGAKATDNCFCATSEHSTALTRDISRCAVDFCTTGTVVPVAVASATGIFRSYCQTNGYGVAAAGNGVSVSAPVQTNNVQSAAASVTVSSRVGSGSGGSPVSTSQEPTTSSQPESTTQGSTLLHTSLITGFTLLGTSPPPTGSPNALSASAPSPSFDTSSIRTGLGVGLGVPLAISLLAIFVLLVFLLRERRHARDLQERLEDAGYRNYSGGRSDSGGRNYGGGRHHNRGRRFNGGRHFNGNGRGGIVDEIEEAGTRYPYPDPESRPRSARQELAGGKNDTWMSELPTAEDEKKAYSEGDGRS